MYRPWVNRKFGVEMEMRAVTVANTSINDQMIRHAITSRTPRLNSRVAGYWHSDGSTWDIKTDASCGFEVASPALELNHAGQNIEMMSVCEGLKTLTPRVDRQCGLHVHVEVRDYDWQDVQKLMSLWARYEPFFFEMLPPSRRGNMYCQPIMRHSWNSPSRGRYTPHAIDAMAAQTSATFQRAGQQIERFSSVNLSNWWRHKRIEFRLHSGTIDYEKIRHWAMLLLAVVQRVKQGAMMGEIDTIRDWSAAWVNRTTGFETKYVCRVLGLVKSKQVPEVPVESTELTQWVNERRLRFGGVAPRQED